MTTTHKIENFDVTDEDGKEIKDLIEFNKDEGWYKIARKYPDGREVRTRIFGEFEAVRKGKKQEEEIEEESEIEEDEAELEAEIEELQSSQSSPSSDGPEKN
jgi:CO dehydrogenase/acetyl-CoA synthase beta subunit